jgi:hypothetical protein
VYENNTKNFAAKGAIVGQGPSGTGSLILGTEDVYIHDNIFRDNKTNAIAIASYVLIYEMGKREAEFLETTSDDVVGSTSIINDKYLLDKNYNPYPRKIKIGNNFYSNSYTFPTINNDFGEILLFKKPFQTVDFMWDGLEAPNADYTICFEEENVSFFGLDVMNDFKNATSDVSKYICD